MRACARAWRARKHARLLASKRVCTGWSIPFRKFNWRLPQGKRLECVCARAHECERARARTLTLMSAAALFYARSHVVERPVAAFQRREQRTPSQLECLACINAHTLDVPKGGPLHAEGPPCTQRCAAFPALMCTRSSCPTSSSSRQGLLWLVSSEAICSLASAATRRT